MKTLAISHQLKNAAINTLSQNFLSLSHDKMEVLVALASWRSYSSKVPSDAAARKELDLRLNALRTLRTKYASKVVANAVCELFSSVSTRAGGASKTFDGKQCD